MAHIARKLFEPHLLRAGQPQYPVMELQGRGVEPSLDGAHPLDEPSGDGRGGFERGVGHHVGDARVLVVPDARDDRQGELCDVGAEAVGVETVQVAARPAAADHHHGIELLHAVGHAAQGVDDRPFGRLALHEGVEELCVEAVGALRQLLAEILIPGGVGARHDGHALHDHRQRDFAVHLPDAVLLQLRDGLLALAFQVAQRVRGVHIGDLQREAVEFVVGDQHFGQHLQSRCEPLSRFGLEVAGDAGVVGLPDHGPGLRRGDSVVAALLDEFEVAVARVVDLDVGDLGAHPEGQGELTFERRFHAAL